MPDISCQKVSSDNTLTSRIDCLWASPEESSIHEEKEYHTTDVEIEIETLQNEKGYRVTNLNHILILPILGKRYTINMPNSHLVEWWWNVGRYNLKLFKRKIHFNWEWKLKFSSCAAISVNKYQKRKIIFKIRYHPYRKKNILNFFLKNCVQLFILLILLI